MILFPEWLNEFIFVHIGSKRIQQQLNLGSHVVATLNLVKDEEKKIRLRIALFFMLLFNFLSLCIFMWCLFTYTWVIFFSCNENAIVVGTVYILINIIFFTLSTTSFKDVITPFDNGVLFDTTLLIYIINRGADAGFRSLFDQQAAHSLQKKGKFFAWTIIMSIFYSFEIILACCHLTFLFTDEETSANTIMAVSGVLIIVFKLPLWMISVGKCWIFIYEFCIKHLPKISAYMVMITWVVLQYTLPPLLFIGLLFPMSNKFRACNSDIHFDETKAVLGESLPIRFNN